MATIRQHILRKDTEIDQYTDLEDHDAHQVLADIQDALQLWGNERGYDVQVRQQGNGRYSIDTMRSGTEPGREARGQLSYDPNDGTGMRNVSIELGELPEDDATELRGWIRAAVETDEETYTILDG